MGLYVGLWLFARLWLVSETRRDISELLFRRYYPLYGTSRPAKTEYKLMKLIKTLNEIQDHVPVQMSTNIGVVRPYIGTAERSHLARAIGRRAFARAEERQVGKGGDSPGKTRGS